MNAIINHFSLQLSLSLSPAKVVSQLFESPSTKELEKKSVLLNSNETNTMYHFARAENSLSTIIYIQMYEKSFERSKTRVYVCVCSWCVCVFVLRRIGEYSRKFYSQYKGYIF